MVQKWLSIPCFHFGKWIRFSIFTACSRCGCQKRRMIWKLVAHTGRFYSKAFDTWYNLSCILNFKPQQSRAYRTRVSHHYFTWGTRQKKKNTFIKIDFKIRMWPYSDRDYLAIFFECYMERFEPTETTMTKNVYENFQTRCLEIAYLSWRLYFNFL